MRTISAFILAVFVGLNGVCVNVVWGADVDPDPPISNDGGSRFHQPPEDNL
jgi:hypothetical protein